MRSYLHSLVAAFLSTPHSLPTGKRQPCWKGKSAGLQQDDGGVAHVRSLCWKEQKQHWCYWSLLQLG